MSWTIKVRFPAEVRNFPLLHSIQIGSAIRPASYKRCIRGYFAGVKRQVRKTDHSSLLNVDVKSDGAITPLIHKSS
jgi:hypothetical protein